MCAAFDSALGKEKIKMKKEDVRIKYKDLVWLYNSPVMFELCYQNMNKL